MIDTKSSQITRTFLWLFSYTFCLAYSPLNSAMLSFSSEVTLLNWMIYKFIPRRNGCEFAQMKVTTSKITQPKPQKLLQDWILNENGLSVEPQSKTIWQNYGLCCNGQAKQNMAWIGKVTTGTLSDLSMMAECRDITGIFQYYILPTIFLMIHHSTFILS